MRSKLAILLSAAAITAFGASSAMAQYPSPQDPIVIAPSDPTPGVGETITLNVVIGDGAEDTAAIFPSGDDLFLSARNPEHAPVQQQVLQAPPYSCTASVSGGVGATISPESFMTDANGAASLSLYTGEEEAVLTASIACGDLSAQVVIPVGLDQTDDGQTGDDDDDGQAPGDDPGDPGDPGDDDDRAPGVGDDDDDRAPGTGTDDGVPAPPATGIGTAAESSGTSNGAWMVIVGLSALVIGSGSFVALKRRSMR